MGWEKPKFEKLAETIRDLEQAVQVSIDKDIEKLKQLRRVVQAQQPKEEQIGLEKDADSGPGIQRD